MGVLNYSSKSNNMKTTLALLIGLVALSQVSAQLGGWSEMNCGKNSMCEKRFRKFMVPKIQDHFEGDNCEWKFCHVESGKYQIVNGMNLDITGYVMAMNSGCTHKTGYTKCNIQAHKMGKELKSMDIDCEDRPMSEMNMM